MASQIIIVVKAAAVHTAPLTSLSILREIKPIMSMKKRKECITNSACDMPG
jgi:hypothetical protein